MGGTNQPKLEVYDWVCHIIINIFVMFILCHTNIWLGIPWPLFPVPSAIWAGRRPVERAETNALTSPKYYFVPFKYVDHLSYHLFLPKRCPHSNGKNIDTIFPDSFLDAFGLIFPARPLGVPGKDHPFLRWRAFFTSASTDSVLSSNFVSLALNSSCVGRMFWCGKAGKF